MKKQLIFFLLLLSSLPVVAQQKKVSELFAGKRWALAYYIEKYDNRMDTLFRVHDCQNEFLEVYSNGSFISPDLKQEGKWSFASDSLLVLTKFGGGRYKTLVVKHISQDSLLLEDRGKNAKNTVFIETYNRCQPNDTTYQDSREIFTIRKSWGLTAGYQQFNYAFAEIGLATGKFEWNNNFFALGGTLELAPWNKTYGVGFNAWTENIFAYGIGASAYTNFDHFAAGIKPMGGVSAKELFGGDFTAHVMYSYNILLGKSDLTTINRHAVTLRCYIPFKKSTRTIRRLIKQEYE